MYLKDGLIAQADGDVGDSAHRHGFWETAKLLKARLGLEEQQDPPGMLPYRSALELLGFPSSPVRHPADWRGPADFSRDQMIPNLTALSLIPAMWAIQYLEILEMKLRSNYYRLPNGDIATPQIWNLIGFRMPSITGQLELLLNCLFCSVKVRINKDDVDQTLNTFCMFACLISRFPNLIILKLCRLVFKHIHPSVTAALSHYFRAESGGNPETADAWEPVVIRTLNPLV